jgi:hypothetical protein
MSIFENATRQGGSDFLGIVRKVDRIGTFIKNEPMGHFTFRRDCLESDDDCETRILIVSHDVFLSSLCAALRESGAADY